MEALKTNAIILTRRPHKEFHGSINVFTRANGKMHLTAMGLYKPTSKLSAILIAGNLVYLTLSKGRQWHITGAKIVAPFSKTHFEPRLLYLSSIIRELLLAVFPSEEVHTEIFDKAVDCLTLLASDKHSIVTKELIVYRFVLAVFKTQGLLPDFSKCSRDSKVLSKDENRFWKLEAGILCEACRKAVGGDAVILPSSIAEVSGYTTGDTLSKEERGAISVLVQDIYSNEHERPLSSLAAWTESMK